jgi:YidC/Oxa1 family membrane protein insertase
MDRRTLVAIILCFGIFLAWNKFYIEKYYPKATSVATTQQVQGTSTGAAPPTLSQEGSPLQSNDASAVKPINKAEKVVTLPVNTSMSVATTGNGSHFFTDWNLKSYKLELAPAAAAVDMDSVTNEKSGQVEFAVDDTAYAYLGNIRGHLEQTSTGTQWVYEDANVRLTRDIRASEATSYTDVVVDAHFKTKKPRYAYIYVQSQGMDKDPQAQDRQLLYFSNNSLERVRLKDSIERKVVETPIKYIGAANRYFLLALLAQGDLHPNALIEPAGPYRGRISLVYPISGDSIKIPLRIYFGPKELDTLRAVDPTLDHTVDFGWFTLFAYPLLKILKWFYQYVQNYGVAIILLTLLLKVLTYPLTYKSMKSMKDMAKIQPQLAKLREKYKDDREALNREMLTVMKSHGYNPAAGCLPILVQMPIFFALYRVLYSSIDLFHAPFAFWIHDLSAHDPFYVTPVLLSVTMFIQQRLTPNTATDPAQARMMQLMPLIFGVFMISLPAGLTLYMLTNAIASIFQQMILNKKFNTGNVTVIPARAR